MTPVLDDGLRDNLPERAGNEGQEFVSGQVVPPGVYVDVESGATVRVAVADELPEGRVVMRYNRRFRRVESETRQAA